MIGLHLWFMRLQTQFIDLIGQILQSKDFFLPKWNLKFAKVELNVCQSGIRFCQNGRFHMKGFTRYASGVVVKQSPGRTKANFRKPRRNFRCRGVLITAQVVVNAIELLPWQTNIDIFGRHCIVEKNLQKYTEA